MKTTSKDIMIATMNGDRTITDHQRENALAILEGAPPPILPELMKQSEVAQTYNTSRQTIWAMTKKELLHPIRLSNGLVRYRRDEVMRIAKEGIA